jgi:hypothetical protein
VHDLQRRRGDASPTAWARWNCAGIEVGHIFSFAQVFEALDAKYLTNGKLQVMKWAMASACHAVAYRQNYDARIPCLPMAPFR